jgi:replication-associated recombination protein RarA
MAVLKTAPAERRSALPDQLANSEFESKISRVPNRRDIIVVYGPAGCGKSSIAQVIAEVFGFTYIEGDEVNSNW